MIAEEDEDTIFETIDEDSGRAEDEEDETNNFVEDNKRDEESLSRKGYRIVLSN